jgi:hypothetical protein
MNCRVTAEYLILSGADGRSSRVVCASHASYVGMAVLDAGVEARIIDIATRVVVCHVYPPSVPMKQKPKLRLV